MNAAQRKIEVKSVAWWSIGAQVRSISEIREAHRKIKIELVEASKLRKDCLSKLESIRQKARTCAIAQLIIEENIRTGS